MFGSASPALPRFSEARINFPSMQIDDLPGSFHDALDSIGYSTLIKPGTRIAIAVGSRGIANLSFLIRYLVEAIRNLDATPFIVPAMGSHGSATAKGQAAILEELGISVETVGAPIHSSMEVACLGRTAENIPVYFDRAAFHSDGVILVNRIREHTDFEGPVQSGLMKMLSIGLGKAMGASAIHGEGAANLPATILSAANVILSKAPILFGVGVVENARDELALIRCALPENFERLDNELLLLARKLTPRLPVDALDVLIVGSIGKNISGTGMDTKIIGRTSMPDVPQPNSPRIKRIAALDLTPESQGNATGLGLADFITCKLFSKIDFKAFYFNQLAAADFEGAKIPIILNSDRGALETAMCLGWSLNPKNIMAMIIQDTKHLEVVLASKALLPELEQLEFCAC